MPNNQTKIIAIKNISMPTITITIKKHKRTRQC